MYNFATTQPQKKKTPWANKLNMLVIHHSGWTTYRSFMNAYNNPKHIWSYHFVIDEIGNSHKFGEPTDIARHAGVSGWWPRHPNDWKKSLNWIALGLCIIWPLVWGGFNHPQRQESVKLTRYLVQMYKIGKENLVRHIDITQYDKWQIANKRYYAGHWMCRKVDIDPKTRDRNKFINEVYS